MSLTKASETNEKQGTVHDSQIKQLNRIAGQVKGVAKMIEERRYCIDILTQLKAVKSSIGSIEKKIMGAHLNHCVHTALKSKDKKKANEVLREIEELLKSVKF